MKTVTVIGHYPCWFREGLDYVTSNEDAENLISKADDKKVEDGEVLYTLNLSDKTSTFFSVTDTTDEADTVNVYEEIVNRHNVVLSQILAIKEKQERKN